MIDYGAIHEPKNSPNLPNSHRLIAASARYLARALNQARPDVSMNRHVIHENPTTASR